jgi:hypothetical protein
MKVGDLVKVYYHRESTDGVYDWSGICTWTDGYKFEFLIDDEFDTWTRDDLETVGAEVING